MNILIGLLPAVLWGIGPLIASLAGGRPSNQLVGTGTGQFVVGLIVYIIFRPYLSGADFWWCFAGGFLWSVAQLMQFTAFVKMNVSTAMPISTGLQLIEIPLVGVLAWGEWASGNDKLLGFMSIVILIVGITLTSIQDKGGSLSKPKLDYKAGLPLLIIGSLGYTACSVFPRIPHASGLQGLMPQTLGMFIGSIVLGYFMQHREKQPVFFHKATIICLSIGIFGGFGSWAYLISLNENGVSNAFPLTQLNVIVSTLGGILLLHEQKTKKEMTFTIIGLALVLISAFIISRLS